MQHVLVMSCIYVRRGQSTSNFPCSCALDVIPGLGGAHMRYQMPKLSSRVDNIIGGGSDGWAILYQARALEAEGVDVINLTIGEHDIRTDASILDAMARSASAGNTGYAPVPGSTELRSAIAARVERITGVKTTAENVLVTGGGQAALFAAHSAALDPGQTGAYISPGYATYEGTIRALACTALELSAKSENNFQPTADDLTPLSQAKSLLINTPCNPTGTVYSRQTIETVSDAVKDNDLWLISDEVYDSQIWDGAHISPRMIDGMIDRTMVVGSMSKSHAMTGSRVGWLIAQEGIIEKLIDLATVTTYGIPGFLQDAALFGLSLGEEFEAKIGAPFRRRRALAERMFGNDPFLRMIPSSGAMYTMLDVRSTGLTGDEFAAQLIDTHRIAIMPGESFGSAAAGHVRIALTIDDAQMEEAFKTIKAFAAERAAQAA